MSRSIGALATRHAVPTMYFLREFVEAGGLLSHGPDIRRGYWQAGDYTGYILGGTKPSELPVLRGTRPRLALAALCPPPVEADISTKTAEFSF
jgi:putative tryptophan/tyrosine transport system substrate-binding protein